VQEKYGREKQIVQWLYAAVLSLQTIEECADFFEDVCTENEIKAMAHRYAIAYWLRRGKTYQHIEREIGASPAKISRVKRCVQDGKQGIARTLERIDVQIDPQ
jgi:TrpR-related protein YerC/YecD